MEGEGVVGGGSGGSIGGVVYGLEGDGIVGIVGDGDGVGDVIGVGVWKRPFLLGGGL